MTIRRQFHCYRWQWTVVAIVRADAVYFGFALLNYILTVLQAALVYSVMPSVALTAHRCQRPERMKALGGFRGKK